MDAQAPKETLIDMQGMGVTRGGRWLVEEVDLTIARGEIVTLIGPNGSGKSTTAKVAIGVLKADAGKVTRRQGIKIGYVPQRFAVEWTMPLTVKRLMTVTGHFSHDAVMAALEEVGVAHLANEAVHHLSGGELQRTLLARAMIRKPDLLVLDEPVQGVDFAGQVALYDLIRDIRHRTGCGILMISHDLHVVMAETDTVICLDRHVCCRGTPESVLKSPEYLQLFGVRAAETLAIYQHHHDHTHLPDGRVRLADGTVMDLETFEETHHHHHDHETEAGNAR